MKTKYLWLGIAGLSVVAGTWLGRVAWRAHRDLVTLHVRNAPLTEVIRKIERQTREKISVDKNLDRLITLDVKNKPLAEVLDRLAQQSGARWTTVYAVYDSKEALPKLESALHGDKKLEEAGWKTIAPNLNLNGIEAGPGRGGGILMTNSLGADGGVTTIPGGGRIMVRPGTAADGNKPVMLTEDVDVIGGGGGGGGRVSSDGTIETASEDGVRVTGTNQGGRIVRNRNQQGPIIRMVRRGRGGSQDSVEEEIWTPVEVVLESRLSPRLKEDFNASATEEGAAEAAREVKGRWKTYYALRKSQIGMDFAGMPGMAQKFRSGRPDSKVQVMESGGTNSGKLMGHAGPSSEDLAEAIRRQRLEELGKLTPEQRVQRAREQQAVVKQKP